MKHAFSSLVFLALANALLSACSSESLDTDANHVEKTWPVIPTLWKSSGKLGSIPETPYNFKIDISTTRTALRARLKNHTVYLDHNRPSFPLIHDMWMCREENDANEGHRNGLKNPIHSLILFANGKHASGRAVKIRNGWNDFEGAFPVRAVKLVFQEYPDTSQIAKSLYRLIRIRLYDDHKVLKNVLTMGPVLHDPNHPRLTRMADSLWQTFRKCSYPTDYRAR